jgi:hypothetical protein
MVISKLRVFEARYPARSVIARVCNIKVFPIFQHAIEQIVLHLVCITNQLNIQSR